MTARAMALAGAMAATFIVMRAYLHLSPDTDLNVAGYNIHHLFTGLVLVTAGGIPAVLLPPRHRLSLPAIALFGIGLSLSLLVGVVLGGRSSLIGAAIGAVIIVLLPFTIDTLSEDRGWPQQVGANLPTLIYGLLVVLVVLVAPAGVAGLWQRRRR